MKKKENKCLCHYQFMSSFPRLNFEQIFIEYVFVGGFAYKFGGKNPVSGLFFKRANEQNSRISNGIHVTQSLGATQPFPYFHIYRVIIWNWVLTNTIWINRYTYYLLILILINILESISCIILTITEVSVIPTHPRSNEVNRLHACAEAQNTLWGKDVKWLLMHDCFITKLCEHNDRRYAYFLSHFCAF